MDSSLQAQLALLRKRIENIDARYAAARPPLPLAEDLSCLGGREVSSSIGVHWEVERFWPASHRHGSLAVDRLSPLAGRRWVYLDTETTGLAGGAGTLAFLIGAARVTPEGVSLRQWFIREHGEEPSALSSLASFLSEFDTLVTFNGRTYDQPLLETRYTLARQRTPFSHLEHLDLLYGARRLWKLRFESCRLVELERHILGHERTGDVPGELIPQLYFEFLRTRRAAKLKPVLEHNALDILSLAFLAAIIPTVFEDPLACHLTHGAELRGLARWLTSQGRLEEASELYRRAVTASTGDTLMFHTLWERGLVEKKLDRHTEALTIWTDLAAAANPYRSAALVELAKHYEHNEKNLFMALECASEAARLDPSADITHRLARLERKLSQRRLQPRLP
ncbi:MAG: ribonuclease H-like domain-containing protein [Acidobacteriota bacterium]